MNATFRGLGVPAAIIGLLVCSLNAFPDPVLPLSGTSASKQHQSSDAEKAATQKPSVVIMEPPTRQDKNSRYWVSASLKAHYLMGFACPGGKSFEWAQWESWRGIRHYPAISPY